MLLLGALSFDYILLKNWSSRDARTSTAQGDYPASCIERKLRGKSWLVLPQSFGKMLECTHHVTSVVFPPATGSDSMLVVCWCNASTSGHALHFISRAAVHDLAYPPSLDAANLATMIHAMATSRFDYFYLFILI